MRLFLAVGIAAALLLSPTAPADAVTFTDLFIFGDSLSDSGNLFTATLSLLPPPPYHEGRFSNGPVYAEVLADRLGLELLRPALLGGTNYAWGGALVGIDISAGPWVIPSVRSQVAQFLASLEGNSVDPQALYIVSGGGNDIMEARQNGLDGTSGVDLMTTAAGALLEAVQLLTDHGAVHILVISAPDIGGTLRFLGNEAATTLSNIYNRALDAGLDGGSVLRYDPSAALKTAVDLGKITDTPCLGSGAQDEVCDNPDDYFFFDSIHPTAAGHLLLAEGMLQVLKAPSLVQVISWARLKTARR